MNKDLEIYKLKMELISGIFKLRMAAIDVTWLVKEIDDAIRTLVYCEPVGPQHCGESDVDRSYRELKQAVEKLVSASKNLEELAKAIVSVADELIEARVAYKAKE